MCACTVCFVEREHIFQSPPWRLPRHPHISGLLNAAGFERQRQMCARLRAMISSAISVRAVYGCYQHFSVEQLTVSSCFCVIIVGKRQCSSTDWLHCVLQSLVMTSIYGGNGISIHLYDEGIMAGILISVNFSLHYLETRDWTMGHVYPDNAIVVLVVYHTDCTQTQASTLPTLDRDYPIAVNARSRLWEIARYRASRNSWHGLDPWTPSNYKKNTDTGTTNGPADDPGGFAELYLVFQTASHLQLLLVYRSCFHLISIQWPITWGLLLYRLVFVQGVPSTILSVLISTMDGINHTIQKQTHNTIHTERNRLTHTWSDSSSFLPKWVALAMAPMAMRFALRPISFPIFQSTSGEIE